MNKNTSQLMTKKSHWAALVLLFPVCFVLAFLSFIALPIFGLLFIALPNIALVAALVVWYKNTSHKNT